MENNEKRKIGPNYNKAIWIPQFVANIVNICLVFSVLISFNQYKLTEKSVKDQLNYNWEQLKITKELEKRKTAIELINKVYNNEFLTSYTKLKSCNSKELYNNELINARNLIISTYYCIAIYYNADLADKYIIEEAIKDGARDFITFPFYNNEAKSPAKVEIEKMVNNINNKKK